MFKSRRVTTGTLQRKATDGGELGAIGESALANGLQTLWQRNETQFLALIKSIIAYSGQTIGEKHGSQSMATLESTLANRLEPLGKVYRKEVLTTRKSPFANLGHIGMKSNFAQMLTV